MVKVQWIIGYICVLAVTLQVAAIPGCPSINDEIVEDPDAGFFDELPYPVCTCDPVTQDKFKRYVNYTSAELALSAKSYSVDCFYESTTANFTAALEAVKAAGFKIRMIELDNTDMTDVLPDNFFEDYPIDSKLDVIITQCAGDEQNLGFGNNSFGSMAPRVEVFHVSNCYFNTDRMDPIVATLTGVKELSVNVPLHHIANEEFVNNKELKWLNLGQCEFVYMETDALVPLTKLETVILGPDNFFNTTIFEAVNQVPSLKEISLDSAKYLSIVPNNSLDQLSNLETLLFYSSSITEIESDAFKGLDNLKKLDVQINLLKTLGKGVFTHVPKLTELQLLGNYLTSDGDQFEGLDNLKTLHIGANDFNNISAGFLKHLPSLETLVIASDRRYEPVLEYVLPGALDEGKNIKTLNLTNGYLTDLPEGVFDTLVNLETVSLAGNSFTELPVSLFENNKKLRNLDISGMELETLDVDVLTPINGSLQRLSFSGNNFTCDDKLGRLIEFVDDKYAESASLGIPFEVPDAVTAYCKRPIYLKDTPLLTLERDELEPYDPLTDTTAAPTTTTENTEVVTIGDDGAIPKGTEDFVPPTKAEPQTAGPDTKLIIIIIVVVLIVLIITVGVIILIVRKRRSDLAKISDTDEVDNGKPTVNGANGKFATPGLNGTPIKNENSNGTTVKQPIPEDTGEAMEMKEKVKIDHDRIEVVTDEK